jgi:hypothetical protein
MTPELQALQDGDRLDRVRIGEYVPQYLRTPYLRGEQARAARLWRDSREGAGPPWAAADRGARPPPPRASPSSRARQPRTIERYAGGRAMGASSWGELRVGARGPGPWTPPARAFPQRNPADLAPPDSEAVLAGCHGERIQRPVRLPLQIRRD